MLISSSNRSILVLTLALGWQIVCCGALPSMAQGPDGSGWTEPIRISEPGNFAFLPFIVADQTSILHAVWSESVTDPLSEQGLDTIFYAVKQGPEWSAPVDIFAVSGQRVALVNRLRVDQIGLLHILWVDRTGEIVYATAQTSEAASAHGWQATRIREPAWVADFALGHDGTVHLAYALERQGIYYAQSADGGLTWTRASSVWLTPSNEYSSGCVRIEVGQDGVLHVAWGLLAASVRWNPVGILYAHSMDNGRSWENTLSFQEGDNLPNIGFGGEGNVHLVWDNPAGSAMGRGHAWSTDGGTSWNGPERIFPGYRGQTWWPAMSLDSAGVLHLITCANPPLGHFSQTFHSEWQHNHWTQPEAISGAFQGSEGPSVAVSGGNQLHVVWFSFGGEEGPANYGIYYTTAQVAAPHVTPRPPVQPQPTLTLTRNSHTPTSVPASPGPRLTSEPVGAGPTADLSSQSQSIGLPIIVGLVPVLLVIGVVLLAQMATRL